MDDTREKKRGLLKIGAFLLVLGLGAVGVRFSPVGEFLSREGITTGVGVLRSSPWAPAIFVPLYAGAVALAVPGTLLTLAGGAVFGLWWGTVYNWLGAVVGANLAYLLARFLGREGIEQLLGQRAKRWPAMERLDQAVQTHGFQGMLTLRLIPLVPFNALNFGGGLVGMRWPAYAAATALGILPGTFIYTMFADAILQGSTEASRGAFLRMAVSGLLLVFLSFLPTLLKKMKVRLPGAGAAAALLALTLLPAPRLPAQEIPNHASFTQLLAVVVHPPAVDYSRLQEERWRLDAYLNELAGTDPIGLAEAPREARLAFWINAYNACMLRLVSDHYPIQKRTSFFDGLRNALAGRPDNSVWQIEDVFQRPHCRVAGSPRSQDEMEHQILRPMGEPRIHFAVNCASGSCPPLVPEAYGPETLDSQLDAAVLGFVSDPTNFRLEDGSPPTLYLNRVLDWYGEDFGGESGLVRFFAEYVDEATRQTLTGNRTRVRFLPYDWTLNDVSR